MTKRSNSNPLGAGRPALFSLGKRLKAQSLYLEGKGYKEISDACGIPRDYLRHLVSESGLSKIRSSPEALARAQSELSRTLAEFEANLSISTQGLALDSVAVVRDAIERGSARDLKDSASGLKSLVEIARLTGGADEDKAVAASAGMNLFFFEGPVRRVEKLVAPVSVEQIQAAPELSEEF